LKIADYKNQEEYVNQNGYLLFIVSNAFKSVKASARIACEKEDRENSGYGIFFSLLTKNIKSKRI